MALKKPGASPTAASAPATATTAPAAVVGGEPSTTSAPAPAASSGPAAAAANFALSTPTAAPAAQARDLAAMRARLAGGQLGGVNSPEGAEKITEELVAPRTQPTADGGAEPIPAPAPIPADAFGVAGVVADAGLTPPKRTRRTKAEMEAARAAASSPPTTPSPGVEAGASAGDLARIADALERIAAAMEHAQATEPF